MRRWVVIWNHAPEKLVVIVVLVYRVKVSTENVPIYVKWNGMSICIPHSWTLPADYNIPAPTREQEVKGLEGCLSSEIRPPCNLQEMALCGETNIKLVKVPYHFQKICYTSDDFF